MLLQYLHLVVVSRLTTNRTHVFLRHKKIASPSASVINTLQVYLVLQFSRPSVFKKGTLLPRKLRLKVPYE